MDLTTTHTRRRRELRRVAADAALTWLGIIGTIAVFALGFYSLITGQQ